MRCRAGPKNVSAETRSPPCYEFIYDITKFTFMPKQVREPIQVYLTSQERAELDRAAAELGVSRSEVLRRGIEAMRARPLSGLLRDLAGEGYVAPATVLAGTVPPSKPVAPLAELLDGLDADRADR
jgi:hypothetical protein